MIHRFFRFISSSAVSTALLACSFGYAAGVTIHGFVDNQHVTVVVAPNGPDLGSPKHDDLCEDKPGEEIADLMTGSGSELPVLDARALK